MVEQLPAPSPVNISSLQSPWSNADFLLKRCWRLQDCPSCLETTDPCSWCAIVCWAPRPTLGSQTGNLDGLLIAYHSQWLPPQSSSCIANDWPIPILAPIGRPGICPLSGERWELRAKGTGCEISTLTFLTVIVAVLSTTALGLLIWATLSLSRRLRRVWKARKSYTERMKHDLRSKWDATRFWYSSKPKRLAEGAEVQAVGEQTRLLAWQWMHWGAMISQTSSRSCGYSMLWVPFQRLVRHLLHR